MLEGRARVLYAEEFLLHSPDPYDHPENPERLRRALRGVERLGTHATVEEPPVGDESAYLRVHTERYYRLVLEGSRGGVEWLDPDTYVSPGTLPALRRLAGAAEMAVEAVREGGGPVFILGRPPGHHAGRDGPALGAPTLGFCIFNTSALVASLLAGHGRVAVIDFDNHHGNGTQEILWREPVAHIDIHQDPSTIYPGTGFPWQTGESPGHPKANICIPPRSGDDIFLDSLELARRVLEEYDPDYVVVSAGFDAHRGDSHFTQLRVTGRGFHRAGQILAPIAERVLIVLEGGYSVGLEEGIPAFLRGLLGGDAPPLAPTSSGPAEWKWYEKRKSELLSALGTV